MLRRLALILLGVALSAAAPSDDEDDERPPASPPKPRVVVVKSLELAPYNGFVAGFGAEVRAQVDVVVAEPGMEGAATTLKAIAAQKPALIVAVGPQAAVAAKAQVQGTPVVFVLVPSHQKYELEAPNVTGIALTSDLSLELSLLAATKKVKRVGIVADPRYSTQLLEDVGNAAKSRSLSLVPLELDSVDRLPRVLSEAAGRVDAMVMIADRTVGSATVVEKIIEWSIAQKVPCVALSAAQVRQGALIAVSPAPVLVGQQAARLVNRIVHEKVDPGTIAVVPPEGLELQFNVTTARRISLSERFLIEALLFATRQGVAVRGME